MEYDYPPNGDVIIQRGEKECPKTPYPISFACAFRLAGTPKGKPWPYCRIVIANADILRDAPWSYETILRHEFGHCNGWPKDHKGARPLGLELRSNEGGKAAMIETFIMGWFAWLVVGWVAWLVLACVPWLIAMWRFWGGAER